MQFWDSIWKKSIRDVHLKHNSEARVDPQKSVSLFFFISVGAAATVRRVFSLSPDALRRSSLRAAFDAGAVWPFAPASDWWTPISGCWVRTANNPVISSQSQLIAPHCLLCSYALLRSFIGLLAPELVGQCMI